MSDSNPVHFQIRDNKPRAASRLFLERLSMDGSIFLKCETPGGTVYTVLGITSSGHLFKCSGVNRSTGLELDDDGRIKEQ